MPDKPSFLRDAPDAQRYRLRELVADGRSYQIVRAEDVESGDEVCAKAILYDEDREEDDDAYVEQRREALASERDRLQTLDIDFMPDVVDWVDVGDEPVLVYEYCQGQTLYSYVKKHSRRGLPPREAIDLMHSLIGPLQQLHEAGYVFRDFDPRHVIVDDDGDVTGWVGTGNVAAIEERPNPSIMHFSDAPYVAPEARNERSGEMLRPMADIYGWGALLSFVLTEREPTTAVESPLPSDSYQALLEVDLEGAALTVAACLQPMAKNRVESFDALDEGLEDDTWIEDNPFETTTGNLPEPWGGAEPPEDPGGRAPQSSLSPGPLISVPSDDEDEPPSDATSLAAAGGQTPSAPDKADDLDDIEGVASDPVREFYSRGDGDGDDDPDLDAIREEGPDLDELKEADPDLEDLDSSDTPDDPVDPIDGEKPEKLDLGDEDEDFEERDDREVDMLEENLGDQEAPEEDDSPEPPEPSLPALSELPFKTRILFGLVLPMSMMVVVFILAFFRVI